MELANSIVTLQPGMYILRHPKTGMPPISISRAAANARHNGQIQALYTPTSDGSVLHDGRDCIVMQILNSPVDLLVTAYLESAGAAVPALKIDKIRLDGEEPAPRSIEAPQNGLSMIGHIERTGDVLAKQGERLGTPESNFRLEGFQLVWPDKPEGVDIEASVTIEGKGPMPAAHVGEFAGTRNAAARVVGVTFKLVGAKAPEFKISGKAHFSGGYGMEIHSGVPLAGPTDMEHLTALQLAVEHAAGRKKSPWEASGKTNVFKNAKAKRR